MALSHALRLYLGRDTHPYPGSHPLAVLEAFGADRAGKLTSEIEMLLEEVGALRPDWEKFSVSSATRWAEDEMQRRHPELEPEAIAALGWAFSYWNK